MTRKQWQAFANHAARDAYLKNFSSRRGVYLVEDADVLCFYDNNPNAFRDEVVARGREQLKATGIKELGFGTYPPPGEKDAGYSFAMIVDAGRDRERPLVELWQETMLAVWDSKEPSA